MTQREDYKQKQQAFLEYLFMEEEDGGAGGNFQKAKVLAGYSPTYATSTLLKTLKKEIEEATRDYLLRSAPKAAVKLHGVLDNPTDIGNKELMGAAKDILDRAGISKVERVDVGSAGGGIFILPAKKSEED